MTSRAEILAVAEGLSLGAGPAALAVDVGGTGMKAALFDAGGRIVDARTAPTPECTHSAATEVMDVIAGFHSAFADEHRDHPVTEAAVVIPGIVDEASGIGILSANLGWRNVAFRELLNERLNLDVTLSHDVRAAGRAEFDLVEDTPADAVMITIGTGIAAAIRVGGRLISSGGYAGEVGFTEVAVDTAEGLFRGPIEHIASASSIAKRYSQRSGTEVAGSLDVLDAVHAGDPIAHQVFAEAVEALAAMCAQIAAVVAPATIVLGGGLSGADELLDGVAAGLESRLDVHRMPSVRRAGLGPVAGLIGAGLLTRDVA
ncbi:ROK family protein [Brevibacterium marinum]|uniref:Glucokinase n=1 Tax=Brevibacterium marinum TaxID=418643 RepID=A0A846RWL7_9MICO|nr:ROK family protein [Brevibacterium marinum]NJC55845.1 glucokinase [Brevibacterium marinum]